MNLKRHRLSSCNLTLREHPLKLLRELGLNYYSQRRGKRRTPAMRYTNFWLRNESHLPFILHDAWKQYRKLIQKAHPDIGGDTHSATRLNLVWKQTRKLFKQRGVTLAVVALALAGCRTPSPLLESPLMLAAEQSPPLPPLKAALAAPGSVSGTINIVWDYPSNELSTNITFKLYHCTNLLTDQFTVFTNVSGLVTSIRLPVEPGVHFFKLTAASLEGFGESDFSEAARCQLPRRGGLEIKP